MLTVAVDRWPAVRTSCRQTVLGGAVRSWVPPTWQAGGEAPLAPPLWHLLLTPGVESESDPRRPQSLGQWKPRPPVWPGRTLARTPWAILLGAITWAQNVTCVAPDNLLGSVSSHPTSLSSSHPCCRLPPRALLCQPACMGPQGCCDVLSRAVCVCGGSPSHLGGVPGWAVGALRPGGGTCVCLSPARGHLAAVWPQGRGHVDGPAVQGLRSAQQVMTTGQDIGPACGCVNGNFPPTVAPS